MTRIVKSVFVLSFLMSCPDVYSQGLVKLSGKITEPVSDSVEVTYNDNRIAYYPKEFYSHVNAKGEFSISFPVPDGQYVQGEIRHGQRVAEVVLRAGDSLYVTANTAHFDSTIHYAGRGSTIQNFIAKHTAERGRMNKYTLKLKEAINADPPGFLKSINKERYDEAAFLKKNSSGLTASFMQYWNAFFDYYNYFFIEQYPQVHQMLRERRFTDSIPQENYSVLAALPLAFNDTFLQVPSYLLYLTGIYDIRLRAAGMAFSRTDAYLSRLMQDSVTALAYSTMPPGSAAYFIGQDIYGRARYQEIARTHEQFAEFKRHWPSSEYLPTIEKQIALAERLAPGQPAPDFDIVAGDKKMKLSSLQGKVVFLGFWASWCKQCLAEIMREKKIKDHFKDQPVIFLSISIDDNAADDEKIIEKYKLEGLFMHTDGAWYAREAQLYGVQALPAYFLIDKDGRLAVQNTPTPSDQEGLISEMERLLK